MGPPGPAGPGVGKGAAAEEGRPAPRPPHTHIELQAERPGDPAVPRLGTHPTEDSPPRSQKGHALVLRTTNSGVRQMVRPTARWETRPRLWAQVAAKQGVLHEAETPAHVSGGEASLKMRRHRARHSVHTCPRSGLDRFLCRLFGCARTRAQPPRRSLRSGEPGRQVRAHGRVGTAPRAAHPYAALASPCGCL